MNVFRFVGNYRQEATRFVLATFLLALPLPAKAALGDNAGSVLTDQVYMKGTLRSVDHGTYSVHEITSATGTMVREFVSPAGAVFAVAWEGQFPPDLQHLLGPYYQQAQKAQQAASSEQQQPRRRGPLAIETPGLVMYESVHARNFRGQAYIPQLLPQNIKVSEIH